MRWGVEKMKIRGVEGWGYLRELRRGGGMGRGVERRTRSDDLKPQSDDMAVGDGGGPPSKAA